MIVKTVEEELTQENWKIRILCTESHCTRAVLKQVHRTYFVLAGIRTTNTASTNLKQQ